MVVGSGVSRTASLTSLSRRDPAVWDASLVGNEVVVFSRDCVRKKVVIEFVMFVHLFVNFSGDGRLFQAVEEELPTRHGPISRPLLRLGRVQI